MTSTGGAYTIRYVPEAATGTPDAEAARSDEEHTEPEEDSAPEIIPAERPRMSDKHRTRALEDIREMVAAASQKDI